MQNEVTKGNGNEKRKAKCYVLVHFTHTRIEKSFFLAVDAAAAADVVFYVLLFPLVLTADHFVRGF